MEGETNIIRQNGDPTSRDLKQQKNPEVLLTIVATDSTTEIVADSDNPVDFTSGSRVSSYPESNHKTNGVSNTVPLSPLYYSPSLSIRKKSKKISTYSQSPSVRGSNRMRETIERSEDWGATFSSAVFTSDDSITFLRDDQNNNIESNNTYARPEKKLIDIGLRLVVMDKTLDGVRMLAFIWSTVVLLGGFASALQKIDFLFVAAIIFIAGTGLFSRKHQLESCFFFQAAKLISGKIGNTITFFQLSAASVSIAFSMTRLVEQNYSEHDEQKDGQNNMKAALNIFYTVALIHALLFLILHAYWIWTFSHLRIIENVREECGFGRSGVVSLRRFFHETYWKLSKGSVFRALDLDLITFAQQLLMSNSSGDQLIAVRILNCYVSHVKFSHETRHRIRASMKTITRLIKMLSWHNQEVRAIRIFAAEVVLALANELQLEGIQEAMDCICSLLKEEIGLNRTTEVQNLLGLKILINLAVNPKNCLKITENSAVLYKIVDFSRINTQTPDINDKVKFAVLRRTLMLLKIIVSTNGKEGQILRSDISQISSIVSNLRDILIYGDIESVLITLVIGILTALSMDKAGQNKIESTDGIIRRLLSIFLKFNHIRSYRIISSHAGDALAMLTLQSEKICSVMLKEKVDVVQQLIVILHSEEVYQCTTAMKILRNMCAYCGNSERHANLKQLITALPWILKTIMSPDTENEVMEASIGLCTQISKFTSTDEFNRILVGEANCSMIGVAGRIQTILIENTYPNAIIPGLRRHILELVIWIMESNDLMIAYFKEAEMESILVKIAETTAEFENFHYFSGNFGVMEYPETISSLVLKAKELLA